MSESTYQDMLDTMMDDPSFDEPPDCPIGIWRLQAISATPKKGDDDRNFIMFVYKPIEAQDDVDAAELEAYIAANGMDIGKIFHRLYFGPDEGYKVRRHVNTFGLDYRGVTMNEALKGFKGYEAFAEIDHQPREDGEGVYVNAIKFASV